MAIYLTNGTCYISHSKTGAIIKVQTMEEAQDFYSVERAIAQTKKAPGKCKGYYFVDTTSTYPVMRRKKKNRKHYSEDVRKMIYNKVDGRCVLCDRKILYKDMTLDHVVPLAAMGGADEVENLACTCFTCNQFRGSILSDDFMERITQIFFYQINKKNCNNWKWKIIRKILLKLSTEK